MSMPKGFKAKNGYATVGERGGLGYREIAEVMTANGDKRINFILEMPVRLST